MATAKSDDDKTAKAVDKAAKAHERMLSGEITWREYLAELGQADPLT